MGQTNLSEIKQILQNTTSEIAVFEKESLRDKNGISDLKIEKLEKLFEKSKNALKDLKNLNIHISTNIKDVDLQILIDSILKIEKDRKKINLSTIQAILSSLQAVNLKLTEIRIDDTDHKRGQKVEKVTQDKLSK